MIIKFDEEKVRSIDDHGIMKVFYLRFYDQELENEFLYIMKAFEETPKALDYTETNGMYKVFSLVESTGFTKWDLLMHKYCAMANDVKKDDNTGEKFYPIRFSVSPIEVCERRFVAV